MPEKLLITFANISQVYLGFINDEIQKIRDGSLRQARLDNYIQVSAESAITYNSLSDLLTSNEGNDVSLIHYSGHSDEDGLTIEWRGTTQQIGKSELVDIIKSRRTIRLVFLNSCYSKAIAEELTDAGVAYVVGTTSKIQDELAAMVAAEFYRQLANRGTTIETAFTLTRNTFTSRTFPDEKIREAFRGFGEEETAENLHPWKLYRKEDLSDADRNWVLVPEKVRNLKLSSADGRSYRLRVLCVYNKGAVKCKDLYTIIAAQFEEDRKNGDIIVQGISEINGDDTPDPADVLAESTAADVVVHITDGVTYGDFITQSYANAIPVWQSKKNMSIQYGSGNALQILINNSLTPRLGHRFPKAVIGEFSIEELEQRLSTTTDKVLLGAVFPDFKNALLEIIDASHVDPETLAEAFQNFRYIKELENCRVYAKSNQKQFFILLDGTPDCTPILVYKRIARLMRIDGNSPVYSFDFSSELEKLQNADEIYWALFRKMLKLPPGEANPFYNNTDACLYQLKSQLQNQDIIIIFDNIGDNKVNEPATQKSMLASFINHLTNKVNEETAKRIFVFAINRQYNNGLSFQDIQLDPLHPHQKLDPIIIQKLLEQEFNEWYTDYSGKFVQPKFQKMSAEYQQFIDQYREKSLLAICNYLNVKTSVVSKIIQL